MAAGLVYRFDYIAPNGAADVFIHGYANREAVNYSTVVYAGFGDGVPNPLGHIYMTTGDTYRHVDGTVAHKVYIQNRAPFNSCTVDVIESVEFF